MSQVSRDSNLKIPKSIDIVEKEINSKLDMFETKKTISHANNEKFNEKKTIKEIENDSELSLTLKVPYNSNDLIVITKAKKLCAYIITITEKSPKKFRGVFVNRMQNHSLDIIENLLNANFIRIDSIDNKRIREQYQKDAIVKLKMLGYISMVAESSKCILPRQYKQISIQIAEVINLLLAWKKSDDDRWRKRKNGF